MSNTIKKPTNKKQGDSGNKGVIRQLKALEKRITQKDLAYELGVSESTLYRYKTGKTKRPKKNIEPLISEIWDSVKKIKPAKNLSEKHEIIKRIESDYKYSGTKVYESSRIANHVYRSKVINFELLENIVDEMQFKFKSPYFMVRIVGTATDLNEEGEEVTIEQSYSTRFVAIHVDGIEELWEQVKTLLSKPSKKLKRVKYFEVVCKEFLP